MIKLRFAYLTLKNLEPSFQFPVSPVSVRTTVRSILQPYSCWTTKDPVTMEPAPLRVTLTSSSQSRILKKRIRSSSPMSIRTLSRYVSALSKLLTSSSTLLVLTIEKLRSYSIHTRLRLPDRCANFGISRTDALALLLS